MNCICNGVNKFCTECFGRGYVDLDRRIPKVEVPLVNKLRAKIDELTARVRQYALKLRDVQHQCELLERENERLRTALGSIGSGQPLVNNVANKSNRTEASAPPHSPAVAEKPAREVQEQTRNNTKADLDSRLKIASPGRKRRWSRQGNANGCNGVFRRAPL